MNHRIKRLGLRLWISSGSILLLGGCGLSDQQLTSILQTVITTGLNTLLSQVVGSVFATSGTTG